MRTLMNDYQTAVEVANGIFAVELRSGGRSLADGPGTVLCEPDERELAGWHLPVRFDSRESAIAAIHSTPDVMFDIEPGSAWSRHCISKGALAL